MVPQTGPGYGPLARVSGPPPAAPTYTLIGAARIVTEPEGRWMNGVSVLPSPPGPAYTWDACDASTGNVKASAGTVPLPEFGAFAVYLTGECSAMGLGSWDEFKSWVAAAFEAVEAAAVEREFLAADALPNNPHLADGEGTFPWGDNPTSVMNGIALLENEIADSGKAGLIHMSPAAAVAAGSHILGDGRGGLLRTINGTPVVPGYGYVGGDGPSTHADPDTTEEWIYATGPVDVRRSELVTLPETLAEALDRENNDVVYRVERYYVVDWDTVVQAAVLVDRCTTECGTPPS